MKKAIVLTVLLLTAFCGWQLAHADQTADLYKKRCASCHGQTGERPGMKGGEVIKGMPGPELKKRLEGYRDGTYGGKRKAMMSRIVKRLSQEEIDNLAKLISTF